MFVIPSSLIAIYIFFQRSKVCWYREGKLSTRILKTGAWWVGIAAFTGLIVLSAMSPRF